MPMIYGVAVGATQSTSGTANTEVDALFVKAGTGRSVFLQSVLSIGKGAGLTAISGIGFRIYKIATASTAGTAITPRPRDPGMQAAKATAASTPTIGTTLTLQQAFGCGAASPGGWVAENPDSVILNESGSAGSIDVISVSAGTSLGFELSATIGE